MNPWRSSPTWSEEAALQPDSVVRNLRITASDGKQYDTRHYNLDVIISVGASSPSAAPAAPGKARESR
jgi:hypothetical protein